MENTFILLALEFYVHCNEISKCETPLSKPQIVVLKVVYGPVQSEDFLVMPSYEPQGEKHSLWSACVPTFE